MSVIRVRNTIVVELLDPVMDFLKLGFGLQAKNTTSSYYNKATSVNRLDKNVVVGEYPNQEVNYTGAILVREPFLLMTRYK